MVTPVRLEAAGVEVRRLKQITGGAEFCEEFLTNVKVPVENRIGEEGEGWVLAQTTLGFERGGSLLARATRHKMVLNRLIDVCRTMPRNGGMAIDDSVVRQKIGKMMVETEVLRYAALRLLSNLQKGKRPGPESPIVSKSRQRKPVVRSPSTIASQCVATTCLASTANNRPDGGPAGRAAPATAMSGSITASASLDGSVRSSPTVSRKRRRRSPLPTSSTSSMR